MAIHRISKGDIMRTVFTKKELNSIDSATPMNLWDEYPPINHVMDYNEPHRFGKIKNLEEEAKLRGITLYHDVQLNYKEFGTVVEALEILKQKSKEDPDLQYATNIMEMALNSEELKKKL
jgi:hypothetical protein